MKSMKVGEKRSAGGSGAGFSLRLLSSSQYVVVSPYGKVPVAAVRMARPKLQMSDA